MNDRIDRFDQNEMTPEELASFASDHSIPRVVTKPEDVGNLDLGPVLVVHGTIDEAGLSYAHAFGPYGSIRTALKSIREGQAEDTCVKTIIRLIPDGSIVLSAADIFGIDVSDDDESDDAKALVN